MTNSAVLFLRPARGADHAGLGPALAGLAARIGARAPGLTLRCAVDAGLLGDDAAHAQETADGPGFAAVIHVSSVDGDQLIAALGGIGNDLAPLIDPAGSAALAGGEHAIVPGDQPLMLAMAIRRLRSLTHEQYLEHWSTVHAELGRSVPGSQGYRQVRPNPELSRRVAAAAGAGVADLDGVALAYYADERAFFAIMGNDEVTGPLLADERTFIDHAASALVCGWDPGARPAG